MPKNWKNIDYLKTGNPKQMSAYYCFLELGIFKKLHEFSPILVGTIPIEIDIDDSDLDIICCFENPTSFLEKVKLCFSKRPDFQTTITDNFVLVQFYSHGFEIEIYGEATPSKRQNAYLHMQVEHRLLKLGNEAFRTAIIQLKESGVKTEPAFGRLLGLKKPYQELLDLGKEVDGVLVALLRGAGF